MRPSGRAPDQLRPVSLEPGFSRHAEGSCLVKFGDTHVLCTASVDERVPLEDVAQCARVLAVWVMRALTR